MERSHRRRYEAKQGPPLSALVKMLVVACLLSAALMGLNTALALALSVFALSVDISQPISTINVISLYWLMTFIIIPDFNNFGSDDYLRWQFLMVEALITSAYAVTRLTFARASGNNIVHISPFARKILSRRARSAWRISILAIASAVFLEILTSGFKRWFSGAVLADAIENYATNDPAAAAARILGYASTWVIFAIFVICRRYNIRLSFWDYMLGLFALPTLALARAQIVSNTLLVMFSERRRFGYLAILTMLATVSAVALGIGQLRLNNLTHAQADRPLEQIITSEFSSAIPYSTLTAYGDQIGLRWGAPIVLPVATSFIPRVLWHDKPLNGSAIYTQYFATGAFNAGYLYAINCLSDMYISFGMPGIWLMCIILGILFGGVDQRIIVNKMRTTDYFLIFNLYSLLRNPLAITITFMICEIITYVVILRFIALGLRDIRSVSVGSRTNPPGTYA